MAAETPMIFNQVSFDGGMNFTQEGTKLADNQYILLVNGRNRLGGITPVKLPLKDMDGLPDGIVLQGVYGADTFLLVFGSGKAYYKDFSQASPIFKQILGFDMPLMPDDDYTEYGPIYAEPVNAAEVSYQRKLKASNDNAEVLSAIAIAGSPVCIICQDGHNQPWKIFPDATAEVSQTYDQWKMDGSEVGALQEYIPIGKYMLWKDPILYIVAKDKTGRYTQILHSVSGRPTDFVVNIDTNGDKGGDAFTVAHRVSFDEITGLNDLNMTDGSFLATTLKTSYVVTPNFTSTVFGEPKFANSKLFPTGPLNPWSIADVNGDVVLIDQSGLKSFNAMKQLKIESNSEPFSGQIFRLFEGIVQTTVCATNYDNYALFSVETVFGPAIIIYDLNLQCFVGIDIYGGIGRIVQFAEVKLSGIRHLYFRTEDDELYQAFGSDVTAICRMYSKENCASDAESEAKPEKVGAVFSGVSESGTAQVTIFCDRFQDTQKIADIDYTLDALSSTKAIPFPQISKNTVKMLTFTFPESSAGWKYGVFLEWNCLASLTHLSSIARSVTPMIDLSQQSSIYQNYVPQT